jgi:hypothetical protein
VRGRRRIDLQCIDFIELRRQSYFYPAPYPVFHAALHCDPMLLATRIAERHAPRPQEAPQPAIDPLEAAKARGMLEAEIEAFRNAPGHEHFDFLRDQGTLKAIADGNPQLSLQQIYDAALAAHPQTREITMATKHRPPRPIAHNGATATILSKMAAKAIGGAPGTSARKILSISSLRANC